MDIVALCRHFKVFFADDSGLTLCQRKIAKSHSLRVNETDERHQSVKNIYLFKGYLTM